jgi:hypothetical protein
MKSSNIFAYLLVLLFLTMSCGQHHKGETRNNPTPQPQKSKIERLEPSKPARSPKEGRRYVPGEVLVKFKAGTDEQSIASIQKQLHLRTAELLEKLNVYRMKIQDGSSVEEIIRRLEDFEEVEYAEPNYIVTCQ